MTWEDYSEFERWLNVAQIALDQAKKSGQGRGRQFVSQVRFANTRRAM